MKALNLFQPSEPLKMFLKTKRRKRVLIKYTFRPNNNFHFNRHYQYKP